MKGSSGGQTLFELIIALGVTVLIVTGIIRIVTISLSNAAFAKNQAEATRFAQEGAEWIRLERDKGWDDFFSRSNQTWCLKDLTWSRASPCGQDEVISGTMFSREATLGALGDDRVDVIVKVSWTDSKGTHESRIGTRLTGWRGASDD